jgi:hypothetical protein
MQAVFRPFFRAVALQLLRSREKESVSSLG